MFLGSVLGLQLTFNLYTAVTLWLAGAAALWAYVRIGAWRGGGAYWLLAGLGLLFLGVDERLDFHERAGERLTEWRVSVPGFHDNDGLVLIAVAVVALAVSVAFRRELLAHREVLVLLLVGAAFTAVAFALDDFGSNDGLAGWAEERAEWAGSVAYLLAVLRRAWVGPSERPGARTVIGAPKGV